MYPDLGAIGVKGWSAGLRVSQLSRWGAGRHRPPTVGHQPNLPKRAVRVSDMSPPERTPEPGQPCSPYVIRRLFSGIVMLIVMSFVTVVLFFSSAVDPRPRDVRQELHPSSGSS